MGNTFGGRNPQQYAHTLHIYFYFQVYCCGEEIVFVSVPFNLPPTTWASLNISLENYLIQTSV